MQHLVLFRHFEILGAHRLDPFFGMHVGQVFWLGAVTGQGERVSSEAGILQSLVHRTQVVLGTAKPMDQEHARFGHAPPAGVTSRSRATTCSTLPSGPRTPASCSFTREYWPPPKCTA